ncbi:MAG: NitT/TauT family transport system ATP-binding protein [Chloroflexota bacterium]|nr:NitT/TauT family transport system ATP-binding protein [Chloroflexota bacterium]
MIAQPKLAIAGLQMEFLRRRTSSSMVVIENLDLDIRDHEFVTIVGPSGCGKSTLLNIVNGLLSPTSGTILIDGAPAAARRSRLGVVFQDASLFPWFTVERNVGYGLECLGTPRSEIRARVAPLLEMVGLSAFGSHFPHELSGGMQQRANLARALAIDPEILLMDEPFAALDAQTREIMQSELLSIWTRTHKTVLFITHQISEAIYLSDRVIVMSARPGRILADLHIPFDRPRALSIKRDPEFTAAEEHIWELLEAQVRSALETNVARGG